MDEMITAIIKFYTINIIMIFILGINSFIAKNFFLTLKKHKKDVTCLNHDDLDNLSNVGNEDIFINFCGINRGKSFDEFNDVNHIFVKKIIAKLNNFNVVPYFVHLSSIMVYGFVNKNISNLPEYQQYFIDSKLKGENYLMHNYPNNKLCIIRPSNIHGYDCEPYYNNILTTLIYEKIKNNHTINKINKNCTRNFLSINGLCMEIEKIINNKRIGIYNIVSNNNISLEILINNIYHNEVPNDIIIEDGEESIPNINNGIQPNVAQTIIHSENLNDIIKMEEKMEKYIALCKNVIVQKLNRLSQSRGDMVEITSLDSKRLYLITLSDHSVRGNHYHYKQIEHFYQYEGKVIFLLAHKNDKDIIFFKVINKDSLVIVNPLIIHTLINDFPKNKCEIIVSSTQPYVTNDIPDTEYINII
jgi:nucleoside-diphosphate-sugar epimerase